MDETTKVLALDLGALTPADILWLHDLKNKATAMTGRLQLKHMKSHEEPLHDLHTPTDPRS